MDQHAADHANQMRTADSTAKFVENRTSNASHVDEVYLEVQAKVLDHPIEHVMKEINAYEFNSQEEQLQSYMWLADLKQAYNPDQYTNHNSKMHNIYMASIGYDTGTIVINGHTIKALLDTGAERSSMKLDTFEKLKLKNLNTSFVPTLKGATGHNMLACDIQINNFTFLIHSPCVLDKIDLLY